MFAPIPFTMITINNPIKNIPSGMVLKRRILHLVTPIGLQNRVFRYWKKPSERLGVIRLVSYIAITQRKEHGDNNLFVNVYWETIRRIAGNNYRKSLLWLEQQNVIEINQKYKVESDAITDAYAKSYRFTDKVFKNSFVVTRWDTNDLCNDNIEIDGNINLTPDGKYDKELLYCIEHERQLRVPDADNIIENLLVGSDRDLPFIQAEASYHFNIINSGDFVPSPQLKSSRFYLQSVMMPRSLRKYLRYGNDRVNLINYDIVTAYPYFIKLIASELDYNNKINNNNITFFERGEEGKGDKGRYNCLVNPPMTFCTESFYKEDFYNKINKEGTYKNRDEVKKAFNSYRNSKRNIKETHQITKRLYAIGEGAMADYIISNDNLWLALETMETELMCAICNLCESNGLVLIRAHDGFLTLPEHKESVDAILAHPKFQNIKFKSEQL